MTGKHFGGGGYEAELNRIRALEDWNIPKAAALQNALSSLDRALGTILQSKAWEGSAAESAKGALTNLQADFRRIDAHVEHVVQIIKVANTVRRVVASTELPSAQVDPFWANAAKGASVVIHPLLGPLAADKALDAISGYLSDNREAEAKKIVESVEEQLQAPARELYAASIELDSVDFKYGDGTPDTSVKEPEQGGPIRQPRITYPGGGSAPSGWQPSMPNYLPPDYPDGGGGWEPGGGGTDPGGTNPGGTNPGGGGSNPGGGPGGGNGDDPSVDSPGGGLLPGGPGGGGTGPGHPTYPGGGSGPGGGGSLPGGLTPGGGGLGGAIGGGAGAAAIAGSSKIAGFGSMGGLGGAGSAAGAGMRSGGGLLGNTPLGGTAGSSGAGAGGGSGAGSSGAAGAGARPGMGMMGGAGGDDEKSKRNGLGGPIAPKIEDEDEAGPRSKGARAGSRDDHRRD